MKLKFLIFFAVCFLTQHYCFAQNTELVKYIKDNAVVIDTNSTTDDLNDLSHLKRSLEGKRIVGMGEATHGTEQFQTTKFRVFKYLVTQMGYKLFGMEANFTECRRVNDFVMYGKGEVKKAIAGMYFWTWNTTEVLKMVKWMRSYNADRPDVKKVKFYGFDMQYDNYATQQIIEKLKKLDSTYYYANFGYLKNLRILNPDNSYKIITKSGADSLADLIEHLNKYLDSQEGKFLKIYSKNDFAYTKRDIRLLSQCFDEARLSVKYGQAVGEAFAIRDKYMAENVEWILNYEGPDSKMMIWAHNNHVSKDFIDRNMGNHLKAKYKDLYYVIGFDFNKGAFRALDAKTNKVITFTVGDAKDSSSSKLFSSLNIPEFFIDMKKAVGSESPAKSFFTTRIPRRSIDVDFIPEKEKVAYLSRPLYDYFDGLIFVNETTGTIPIR